MITKLFTIKKIKGNKFEVTALVNSKLRKFVISRVKDISIPGMTNMSRIVSDTNGFDELWGSSLKIRKEISNRIDGITQKGHKALAKTV